MRAYVQPLCECFILTPDALKCTLAPASICAAYCNIWRVYEDRPVAAASQYQFRSEDTPSVKRELITGALLYDFVQKQMKQTCAVCKAGRNMTVASESRH